MRTVKNMVNITAHGFVSKKSRDTSMDHVTAESLLHKEFLDWASTEAKKMNGWIWVWFCGIQVNSKMHQNAFVKVGKDTVSGDKNLRTIYRSPALKGRHLLSQVLEKNRCLKEGRTLMLGRRVYALTTDTRTQLLFKSMQLLSVKNKCSSVVHLRKGH